jgi:hypothetical protein
MGNLRPYVENKLKRLYHKLSLIRILPTCSLKCREHYHPYSSVTRAPPRRVNCKSASLRVDYKSAPTQGQLQERPHIGSTTRVPPNRVDYKSAPTQGRLQECPHTGSTTRVPPHRVYYSNYKSTSQMVTKIAPNTGSIT